MDDKTEAQGTLYSGRVYLKMRSPGLQTQIQALPQSLNFCRESIASNTEMGKMKNELHSILRANKLITTIICLGFDRVHTFAHGGGAQGK